MQPDFDISPFTEVEESIYSSISSLSENPQPNPLNVYELLLNSNLYNHFIHSTSQTECTNYARYAIQNCKGKILDIGCGQLNSTAVSYARSHESIVLLDASKKMLRLGKKRICKYTGHLPDNILCLHANALNIPFTDHYFNHIFSFCTLHLFPNKTDFIKEALRVIAPGGTFYFSALTSNYPMSNVYSNLFKTNSRGYFPLQTQEYVSLLKNSVQELYYKRNGSMLYLWGVK